MESDAVGITAAIGLGSNLGDRAARLHEAIDRLSVLRLTRLLVVSRFVETEPLPRPDGGDPGGPYLNAVALLHTRLSARDLLEALLTIERQAGRVRGEPGAGRWAARTLDLDLLVYGAHVIDEPGLTVPHPRLHERAFVLAPLAEISPDLPIPGGHGARTSAALLAALQQGCSS